MNDFADRNQHSCWGVAAKATCVMAALLFLAWLIRIDHQPPAAAPLAAEDVTAG